MCSRVPQQEVENFKKLNVISKDEFDTLTPKVPIDPNQEVPPMPGGFVALRAERPVYCSLHFKHTFVTSQFVMSLSDGILLNYVSVCMTLSPF